MSVSGTAASRPWPRPLVLASGSTYRAEVLRRAGIDVDIVRPDVDERALDHRFDPADPGAFALLLARAKAESVLGRVPLGSIVIAADQLGVLGDALLHQPGTVERAVEQLMQMSATTHRLINGLVVCCEGEWHQAVDVHRVTMHSFDRSEAVAYVEAYRPLDTVGGYRIEDRGGGADLVESVSGSGDDGVMGLPVEVLRGLLARCP